MTTSRAEAEARLKERRRREAQEWAASRRLEFILLLAASIVVAAALGLAYAAKIQLARSAEGPVLNLNNLRTREELLPLLGFLSNPDDREFAARKIHAATRHGNRLSNVGAIGRIRVTEAEIAANRRLESFNTRFAQARAMRQARVRERQARLTWFGRLWEKLRPPPERLLSIPLLAGGQLAELKPRLSVRELGEFRNRFFLWAALFLISFYAAHVFWRARGFAGDNILLPAICLLCGLGLTLMIGMRDPLRDSLAFIDFSQGVVAGVIAMAACSVVDYQRRFGRLSFVPLILALLLALALGLFGSGPGASDAKVNLWFFQPIELIRILLVLFLAGYFAQNWDALRALRQPGALARRFNIPRLDYVLPVAAGVALALLLFFWLSDLGPALVAGSLFLVLYAIARARAGLALAGLIVIVLGFWAGHAIGKPETASERVDMWLSQWDNDVRGGDQIAAALWAFSAGGVTGTGPGLGSPGVVPAAHTDLVISALGEEAGFLGTLALYALYGVIVWRSLRIALDARDVHSFFLATGLALATALQILLISGGVLGLIPLSGVVSPFLSYGRTSMVANFVLVAIVLSISATAARDEQAARFGKPVRALAATLGLAGVAILARAAWVQVIRADDFLIRPALVPQADGIRRYQYNPRIMAAARLVPKGDIYDRNGLPLATSSWDKIEEHRQEYEALGVPPNRAASKSDKRHYPLGPPLFYLLGDLRVPLKQGASNTAFQERASRIRLQGYNDEPEVELVEDPESGDMIRRVRYDYRELIPLVRHRYEPDNAQVKEILSRPRDVRMSIDAGLQLRAARILRDHLLRMGKRKGALVIIDPATGDLLASVSYPWPAPEQFAASMESEQDSDKDLLDRARFGLYPPGSSFKVVTAVAALGKDPALARERFDCVRLPDGRVGAFLKNSKRPIRDDIRDTQPHGSVDMAKGIVVSCNAYFAQLGAYRVGPQALLEAANRFGITVARPNRANKLRESLPQASYGQGQVVASPFQMARVAAAVANGGFALQGRWVIDETNPRTGEPVAVLPPELAGQIAHYMRTAITSGTGRVLAKSAIPIAGKTGTAELQHAPSHAWFIGFAPYDARDAKQIAFAVLVENGQYGGTAAAPIAGDIVALAHEMGYL